MKEVKIILRNPVDKKKTIDYTISAYDTKLSKDWLNALEKDIVEPNLRLEKNFTFLTTFP